MRTAPIAAICTLLLIAACAGGGKVSLTTFLGGNDGISIEFDKNAPPKEVFDGGDFPFDVVVKLQNKGEYAVAKDNVKVTITGIRPQEFDQTDAGLKKAPDEDLTERKKDTQGSPVEPNQVYVEFKDFNHKTD
ncbi:MAG: hypothetical protein AABY13_03820, partial [Nanoarchaeota archaeon]